MTNTVRGDRAAIGGLLLGLTTLGIVRLVTLPVPQDPPSLIALVAKPNHQITALMVEGHRFTYSLAINGRVEERAVGLILTVSCPQDGVRKFGDGVARYYEEANRICAPVSRRFTSGYNSGGPGLDRATGRYVYWCHVAIDDWGFRPGQSRRCVAAVGRFGRRKSALSRTAVYFPTNDSK